MPPDRQDRGRPRQQLPPDLSAEPALAGRSAGDGSDLGDEPALRALGLTGLSTYGDRYRRRREATAPARRWGALALAAVAAGPFAVLGALIGTPSGVGLVGFLYVVVIGPLIEEVLKAAGAFYLAEQRPWLVPAAWTLPLAALAAGLVFAAIENLVYLNVYIPDPSAEIVRWRWIAGPALHGGASLLAGFGVARMWRRSHQRGEPPNPSEAVPGVVGAAVLHGGYNATVTVLELTGVIF